MDGQFYRISFVNNCLWVMVRARVVQADGPPRYFSERDGDIVLPAADGPIQVTFEACRFLGEWRAFTRWNRQHNEWVAPKAPVDLTYRVPITRRFVLKGLLHREKITNVRDERDAEQSSEW